MAVHHEKVFGDAIVAAMCAGGWIEREQADYRPELGLDTRQLFTFIGATQPDDWEELVTYYGGDRNEAQRGFAKWLNKAIADRGLLDVLRKGVRDNGVRIQLAYSHPSFVESDGSWMTTAATGSPWSASCRTRPSRPTAATGSTWPCSSTAFRSPPPS